MTTDTDLSAERVDLLETLAQHRHFLRNTARGLTDEQAATRSTVSELTVGGLIKHVADQERLWQEFIAVGTSAMPDSDDPAGQQRYVDSFRMAPGETLAGLLAAYDEVARRTEELIRTVPDLDAAHPLPAAPWFPPGARWSLRRVLLHIAAETAQHAGHADIIREAIDGAKTMG
ncbi:DinB family protein [Plantactinospora siamensis]|uniref:DinB family protein n=1 Tax=Plantactinospora siamensis TaxID=555372 RepID=A0ABV6P2T2_9ACTN